MSDDADPRVLRASLRAARERIADLERSLAQAQARLTVLQVRCSLLERVREEVATRYRP